MGLTCAVPKGRPMEDLLPYLAQIGGSEEIWRDISRKLQVVDEGLGLTYFLSKSKDVPTYVEYGAADIGIVGKDVLTVICKPVVELLDLGLSRCRMIVAVPEGSGITSVGDLHFNSRVGTSYPNVAERFFHSRGIQVEVIPLSGSVELGPIVGLADAIVDITETGTTLRENGLRIIGEVMTSSLRLVANPVSYKVSYDAIRSLAARLRPLMPVGVSGA